MLEKIVSFIALIVSILSLAFTTWQYFDNKKSIVGIRIKPMYNHPVEKVYDKEIGQYFYKKRFKIILSNNASSSTSLVDWGVYLKTKIKEKQNEKSLYIWMAHVKPTLLQLNEKEFTFPTNIKAGESLAFFMDVYIQNINNESNDFDYVIKFEKSDGTELEALFNPIIAYAMQGEK